MTRPPALWLRETEVTSLLDLPGAIGALERALAIEAEGGVAHLEKTHAAFGDGDTLHALGAVLTDPTAPDDALAGTKTWAHTHGGATPLLLLWSAADGRLEAIVEAFALGQLRTSGVSGVATRLLADPHADELALVGSGKQALAQVAAVAGVRHLRRVRVFSPTPEHRARFAERAERELDIATRATETVEECTRDAPVITLATRATRPFLGSAMVARGAHVNAIGAITPERAEVAPDLLARVSLAVADAPGTARRLSSELSDASLALHRLCDVVAGRVVRPAAPDVTLFKAMGTGLADVALGAAVLALARARGLGRAIERPERAAPRLLTDAVRASKPESGGGR